MPDHESAQAHRRAGAQGAILECHGVVQRYEGRQVLGVEAFRLDAGERIAIVGPNGAGKSTLLRLLAFVERPAAGTISMGGVPVVADRAYRAARRRVTLVEQRPFLFRGTVLANVGYGLRARSVPTGEANRRAAAALAALEAGGLAARDARALSGGEIQRVAVARALALDPDVLLLDEPVSGADRAAQHALYAAISASPQGRPMSVCVATHHIEDAYRWADRMLALHDGVPSPVTPDNLFRITLPGPGPMQPVRIGTLTIDVVSDRIGPVTLAIPPEEIVLSREPLHSSARNVLTGRVVRVAEQGAAVRVTVEGGAELVALITRRSYEELGFAVGSPACASFKSVAVRVF